MTVSVWASDTSFSPPVASGPSQDTKIAPSAGSIAQGLLPNTRNAAQHLNWILNALCTQANANEAAIVAHALQDAYDAGEAVTIATGTPIALTADVAGETLLTVGDVGVAGEGAQIGSALVQGGPSGEAQLKHNGAASLGFTMTSASVCAIAGSDLDVTATNEIDLVVTGGTSVKLEAGEVQVSGGPVAVKAQGGVLLYDADDSHALGIYPAASMTANLNLVMPDGPPTGNSLPVVASGGGVSWLPVAHGDFDSGDVTCSVGTDTLTVEGGSWTLIGDVVHFSARGLVSLDAAQTYATLTLAVPYGSVTSGSQAIVSNIWNTSLGGSAWTVGDMPSTTNLSVQYVVGGVADSATLEWSISGTYKAS